MIIVKLCNALSNKFGGFLSKIIHSTGMPIQIIIRKMIFFRLLLKIVAQWDYCYRTESVRKYICSRSSTPIDSKALTFFSRSDNLLLNLLLSCTHWNVGFKIRQIISHFTMFQILLLMLTFPWPGPLVMVISFAKAGLLCRATTSPALNYPALNSLNHSVVRY